MIRNGLLLLALLAPPADAQETVHQRVRDMMSEGDGSVVFSDLYNSNELSTPEREYLARLYEIFFAIPVLLRSESESRGKVPLLAEIAANFGIEREAVALLLTVMTSDPRMPSLMTRDETSGEILSVDVEVVDKFIEQRGADVTVSGWSGKPAPEFQVTTLDGKTVSREDLLGKSTVIFFWLTRCPVCQRITPTMVELEKKHRSPDFQILGFNADDVLGLGVSDEERREFIRERGILYDNAMLDAETRAAFGNGNIFPSLFLVGKDGKVSRLLINFQDFETLDRLIQELKASR